MKFVERDNQLYERPDFVSNHKCHTIRMCNVLFEALGKTGSSMEEKVEFWKSYRDMIKSWFSRARSHSTFEMKIDFMSGKYYFKACHLLLYFSLILTYICCILVIHCL